MTGISTAISKGETVDDDDRADNDYNGCLWVAPEKGTLNTHLLLLLF